MMMMMICVSMHIRLESPHPLLWPLIADSLPVWLSKQVIFAQGYADDGSALTCNKVITTISKIMQCLLRGIQAWYDKHLIN